MKGQKFILCDIMTQYSTLPAMRPEQHTISSHKKKIIHAIKNRSALACFDAALKSNVLVYYIIITDIDNTLEVHFQEVIKIWHSTNSDVAKGRALLALCHSLVKIGVEYITGAIQIYTDSRNAVKWSTIPLTASKAAKPGVKVWLSIQRTIQKMATVNFHLENILGHPKLCNSFTKTPKSTLSLSVIITRTTYAYIWRPVFLQ